MKNGTEHILKYVDVAVSLLLVFILVVSLNYLIKFRIDQVDVQPVIEYHSAAIKIVSNFPFYGWIQEFSAGIYLHIMPIIQSPLTLTIYYESANKILTYIIDPNEYTIIWLPFL